MKKSIAALGVCLPLFIEIMHAVQDFIQNHTTIEKIPFKQPPMITDMDPLDEYRNLHEVIADLEAKHPQTLKKTLLENLLMLKLLNISLLIYP